MITTRPGPMTRRDRMRATHDLIRNNPALTPQPGVPVSGAPPAPPEPPPALPAPADDEAAPEEAAEHEEKPEE